MKIKLKIRRNTRMQIMVRINVRTKIIIYEGEC